MGGERYYMVAESVLPDAFLKVINTKQMLLQGQVKTINEAVNAVGISRSVFYKYRDKLYTVYEASKSGIVTFCMNVNDEAGVLSALLNIFSDFGANILTINQNIPIDGTAQISVALRTENMNGTCGELTEKLERVKGVLRVAVMNSENII